MSSRAQQRLIFWRKVRVAYPETAYYKSPLIINFYSRFFPVMSCSVLRDFRMFLLHSPASAATHDALQLAGFGSCKDSEKGSAVKAHQAVLFVSIVLLLYVNIILSDDMHLTV